MILMEGSAQVFPSAAVAPCTNPPPMQVNGVAQENCPTAQLLYCTALLYMWHMGALHKFSLFGNMKRPSPLCPGSCVLSLLSLSLGGAAAKILCSV